MNVKNVKNVELFLEQLLPICNDAITMINEKGEVLYWNKGAEIAYQISKKKILGKKISDFFKQEDLMVLRILMEPTPVQGVYHRPRPDTHVVINASPVFDEQGSLIGAISVEQNVSKLVKLNEELLQTSSQLDALKYQVNHEETVHPFSSIKGNSTVLQKIVKLAQKVAKTDATILITGESGVGKDLFARAIHRSSYRKDKPFIPINCGAIPSALFESELFGYEAGSFTGATKHGKKGKLELANEGTLFLDEIGELPLDMQVKLLRVLQEQEYFRVGGTEKVKVNVRIITATNRELEQQIVNGQFREDLYYRLHVVSLNIPPLRERKEDIQELIHLFLNEFSTKYQKPTPPLKEEVLRYLLNYEWPGNIRQLRNMIERYVVLYDGEDSYLQAFPQLPKETAPSPSIYTLIDEKVELEKQRIYEALKVTYGNKSAAAKRLGITRATLYQKMKKYNLTFDV